MRATIVRLLLRISNKFYNAWIKLFMVPYWKESFKKIGDKVFIGKKCTLTYSHIELGNNVFIGDYASFIASIAYIHIGNNVMFGPNVTIRGDNHRTDVVGKYMVDISEKEKLASNDKDVFIDDDVWIGCNVTILKGVHIGKGAVIGAGSVVVKDVPPYTIHVGNLPVREKRRFTDEEIAEHERILVKVNTEKSYLGDERL